MNNKIRCTYIREQMLFQRKYLRKIPLLAYKGTSFFLWEPLIIFLQSDNDKILISSAIIKKPILFQRKLSVIK